MAKLGPPPEPLPQKDKRADPIKGRLFCYKHKFGKKPFKLDGISLIEPMDSPGRSVVSTLV